MSATVLSVILLNIIYAECRYGQCRCVECRGANKMRLILNLQTGRNSINLFSSVS